MSKQLLRIVGRYCYILMGYRNLQIIDLLCLITFQCHTDTDLFQAIGYVGCAWYVFAPLTVAYLVFDIRIF